MSLEAVYLLLGCWPGMGELGFGHFDNKQIPDRDEIYTWIGMWRVKRKVAGQSTHGEVSKDIGLVYTYINEADRLREVAN